MATQTRAILKLASRNAETGDILYTWELTFPRIILAEINTHRMASRNTSSSRAISLKKLRRKIWCDPYLPIHIGADIKGMQAGEELSGWRLKVAETANRVFRYPALLHHWILMKVGVHKQVSNRYLEPWMWCTQVLSATDVNNLLMLRTDSAAEPNFRDLAIQMQAQVNYVRAWFANSDQERPYKWSYNFKSGNGPGVERIQTLPLFSWHMPYLSRTEIMMKLPIEDLKKLSMARCANTSYTMPGDEGKKMELAQANSICEKLFGGNIKHLSPTEHVATPLRTSVYDGNFRGWHQYRKDISNEHGGDR